MGFDLDEDILQDFLVEAGEILELLQEQLVELENNPDDANLLNAIFRGFHTVKGGAGFLSLTELVDACHGAENVFDILRTGKRRVTPELMDVILQALDAVNAMFADVQNREPLTPADPAIIEALHRLSMPESEDELQAHHAAPAEPEPEAEISMEEFDAVVEFAAAPAVESSSSIDEISDDEFESLLDELHGSGAPGRDTSANLPPPATKETASEDITDDEFEAILDQLHGQGSFIPGEVAASAPVEKTPAKKEDKAKAASDDISEDEFESLLDELHGKGKAPVAVVSASTPADKATEPVKAAPPASAAAKAAPVAAAPKIRMLILKLQLTNQKLQFGLTPSAWTRS